MNLPPSLPDTDGKRGRRYALTNNSLWSPGTAAPALSRLKFAAREDARGFAEAVADGSPVTALSDEFGHTWFSSDLPRSIPEGQVLLGVGANAEQTDGLESVTREVADQQLAASCATS